MRMKVLKNVKFSFVSGVSFELAGLGFTIRVVHSLSVVCSKVDLFF